jgi:hypothetical protein
VTVQLEMFHAPVTVPCPPCVCPYESPCAKQGRAVYGPVERVSEDCEQQCVTCQRCGRIGLISTNIRLVRR